MKKIITNLGLKIINRLEFLKIKRNNKIIINQITEKYNLSDSIEQNKIIEQFQLIQKNKRAFGRKARLHIEQKIDFMLVNNLIK